MKLIKLKEDYMMNLIKTLIVILVIINISPARAIPAKPTDKEITTLNEKKSIDAFIMNMLTALNIQSATSIAVVEGDNVIYQNTFGYADIENKVSANKETLFYIASATKPLFALTLLQALDRSEYDLQFTLAEMFPKINFDSNIQADKVTIESLLAHTSGLDDIYLTTAVSTSGVHTPHDKLKMLAQLFPNKENQLGQFDYTNLGYNILSIWYEKAFGLSWQEGMDKDVFSALNMQHSTAIVSETKREGWNLAKPYSFFEKEQGKALYLTKKDNTMHAAGGVMSTSTDMAQLIKAQLGTDKNKNFQTSLNKYIKLSQQKVAEVNSKRGDFVRDSYALGWYIGQYKEQLTYHHFGAFDGFRPHLSFMPEKKLGLVILNNEGMLNDKLTDIIADFIYSQLLEEEGANSRIAKKLIKFNTMANGYREKIVTKEQNYQSKPLQLSLPLKQYTGVYQHPLAGSVNVSMIDEKLKFSWGNLHSTATGYDKQDALRVKLRPSRAQLATFNVVEDAILTVKLDGIVFSKS